MQQKKSSGKYCLFMVVFLLSTAADSYTQKLQKATDSIGFLFAITEPVDIKRIVVLDSALKKNIENFIEEQMRIDTLFKQKGYVYLKQRRKISDKTGTLMCCFFLTKSYYHLYHDSPDNQFPPFYTFIKDRLVMIYANDAIQYPFRRRSKKQLIRMVNQNLGKPIVQLAKNAEGDIIELRPKGEIVLHGGKIICICD